jgi:8-oxo-dGTP pyrophosphatase MutT (NUDIX family)
VSIRNAVLVPYEASGRILVQDRRGHRPPPWGLFGGAVELGETPLEAVIREAREELSVSLWPEELTGMDELVGEFGDLRFTLHPFWWSFDGDLSRFVQREGAGMELVTPAQMLGRTAPGGPDHTLPLALERYGRGSGFAG